MKIKVDNLLELKRICCALEIRYPEHVNLKNAIQAAEQNDFVAIFGYLTKEERAQAGMWEEKPSNIMSSSSPRLYTSVKLHPSCLAEPDNVRLDGVRIFPTLKG